MELFSELEASVRGSSDMASDTGRTPQSLILSLANEEYAEVVRRLADTAPDFYRAISAELSITDVATNYLDIAAITTLMQILEVQRKSNNRWFDIGPAEPNPEAVNKLTWRQRGFAGTGAKIDIFPAEKSVATYRVQYAAFPGALTASPDADIKLPLGGRKYLAGCVSARIRHREEEDESFMISVRNDGFASLMRGIEPKGGVIGTNGRY